MLCGISSSFPEVFPTSGQVTHVLLTRPPLNRGVAPSASFDLHVLSTPPAFILSQDQTLHLKCFHDTGSRRNSHRQIRVKSCFSIQETLLFLKKQEKDVWHALLSFQGTESPGSPRRTTPCFRRSEWKRPSKDGNFSFFDFRRSVNCFPRSRPSGERRLAQRRDPLKIWEPLRGCAI
jgi:hypothetical protein